MSRPRVLLCNGLLLSSYNKGLIFLCLVCLLWSLCSILVQYIYTNLGFDSPFLMTYLGASLFALLLPLHHVLYQTPPEEIAADFYSFDATDIPIEIRSPSQEDVLTMIQPVASFTKAWTAKNHFKTGAKIAPVWFLANFCFNLALQMTSISSSAVLVSTSSIFVLLFAVWSGDERFEYIKLAGVLLTVFGTALTTFSDSDDEECMDECEHPLQGDFYALLAAMAFGAYGVQVRLLCPKREHLYSMHLILGYMGLVIVVALSPIAAWRSMGRGDWAYLVVMLILLRGLFDYVICEYLFFRAVVLTNATIATVGLGLTVPIAFVADCFLDNLDAVSFLSVSGAVAVVAGFIAVNFSVTDERQSDDESQSDHESCSPMDP